MQGTKLQKQVLKEYFINPDKINSEADKIIEKYSFYDGNKLLLANWHCVGI